MIRFYKAMCTTIAIPTYSEKLYMEYKDGRKLSSTSDITLLTEGSDFVDMMIVYCYDKMGKGTYHCKNSQHLLMYDAILHFRTDTVTVRVHQELTRREKREFVIHHNRYHIDRFEHDGTVIENPLKPFWEL